MTANPNLGAVELAAASLGDLTQDLVLMGGCAVGLLITDTARAPVRQTIDVDLITAVTPIASYYELCEQLRRFGFSEQPTDDVIVRWAKDTLLIDVVPADQAVLGFTNSWYGAAAQNSETYLLPSGRSIRLITAPYFLATKLEAFRSRGGGDYIHHDMEDIVTVIDGRTTVVDEVLASDEEVRLFLMDEFEALLADPTFVDRLAWLLSPSELETRRPIVLHRMQRIAGL